MGNYKLDCRFNKTDLIKRIERIGKMDKHIHVTNYDTETWLPMIDTLVPTNSLIYLDPPYYEKVQVIQEKLRYYVAVAQRLKCNLNRSKIFDALNC